MSKMVKRGPNGRFAKGTKGGPGNTPIGARVQAVKRIVFETVSPEDVAKVVRKITSEAKSGKPWACKLFCDLLLGKPDHKFDPRQGLTAEDEQKQTPQHSLEEQLLFYQGAAAAIQAQLRAKETDEP